MEQAAAEWRRYTRKYSRPCMTCNPQYTCGTFREWILDKGLDTDFAFAVIVLGKTKEEALFEVL